MGVIEYQVKRCLNCGKVIGEVDLTDGRVKIKCHQCGSFNLFIVVNPDDPDSRETKQEISAGYSHRK